MEIQIYEAKETRQSFESMDYLNFIGKKNAFFAQRHFSADQLYQNTRITESTHKTNRKRADRRHKLCKRVIGKSNTFLRTGSTLQRLIIIRVPVSMAVNARSSGLRRKIRSEFELFHLPLQHIEERLGTRLVSLDFRTWREYKMIARLTSYLLRRRIDEFYHGRWSAHVDLELCSTNWNADFLSLWNLLAHRKKRLANSSRVYYFGSSVGQYLTFNYYDKMEGNRVLNNILRIHIHKITH